VVNIDLPKTNTAHRLIGKMLPVLFTDALAHSLKGQLIIQDELVTE
jgi:tRNA-2-methylthio-N6-dimethylallyladenosine synthase